MHLEPTNLEEEASLLFFSGTVIDYSSCLSMAFLSIDTQKKQRQVTWVVLLWAFAIEKSIEMRFFLIGLDKLNPLKSYFRRRVFVGLHISKIN